MNTNATNNKMKDLYLIQKKDIHDVYISRLTDYKTKDQYLTQITSISDQHNSMLIDYKTKYIASNQTPTNKTKKRFLDESSSNLDKKFNELVRYKQRLLRQNDDLVSKVSGLNGKIKTEKTKNAKYKKQLASLDPIKSSATVLISDYKTNYNDKNTKNWSLLVGILVSCAMITFMFRIPTTKDEMLRVKEETISKLYKEGSEYASKYRNLKEIGKREAVEAEAKINSYYEQTKKYRERANELVAETAKVAASGKKN